MNETAPVLTNPPHTPFRVQAALFFLDAGHYLLRSYDGKNSTTAKFVTAADVSAAFSGQERDTGWIPAGLVRCGNCAAGPMFVYSAPAQKVDIVLNGERLTIPIPRTVLCGVGSVYYIWAVRSKTFDPQARAYHAPFPNVYSENTRPGRICWGQNTPGDALPERARKLWELFFALPFNSDLASGKSSNYRNNVCALLAYLPNSCPNKFPESDLVSIGETIETLVERVTGA